MFDKLIAKATLGLQMIRNRGIQHESPIRGEYLKFQHIRDGVVLNEFSFKNDIVTAGKNYLLGTGFHADTQITTWYLGLVDNSGYTAFAAGDTLASHAGWTEFSTYTGNRPSWGPDAASAGAISNSTSVSFVMSASGVLKGAFLCSAATGTTGTLWATGAFPGGTVTVANGDEIKITYGVSL